MQCAKDPRYICPRETCLHEICPPGHELAEGEGPASRPRHAAAGDVNRSQECADCECLRIQRKFYAVGKSQNRCVQLPLDALNLGDSTRLPPRRAAELSAFARWFRCDGIGRATNGSKASGSNQREKLNGGPAHARTS